MATNIESEIPSKDLEETIPTYFNVMCFLAKLKRERHKNTRTVSNIKSTIYTKLEEIWSNENLKIKSQKAVIKHLDRLENTYNKLRSTQNLNGNPWKEWKSIKNTEDKLKIDHAKQRVKIIPTRKITQLKKVKKIKEKAEKLRITKYNKRKHREKDRAEEWRKLKQQ